MLLKEVDNGELIQKTVIERNMKHKSQMEWPYLFVNGHRLIDSCLNNLIGFSSGFIRRGSYQLTRSYL